MHRLEIELLGPPKITLDGKPVETDRHKAIGLLAYLAVEAKGHSRETLAALLWPDYPRASAFSYLRRTLWELNQILGKGWIETDRDSVTLARPPGLNVDVEAFQRVLDSGSDQASALAEAASLYRGDFLADLVIADTPPFEDWQLQEVEYYRREYARLLERLVVAYEGNGEYERALPHAQRWLALDRLNESAYRAVMRQMAGMGDRSGAVHVYQTCLRTLKSELGVAPQTETEQLYQAILQGEQPKRQPAESAQPTASGASKPTGNLPCPSTPFIGRNEEIEQVMKLALDPHTHLLTLTGPGGTGKTRISIQAAAGLAESFPDGAWFIPLAAVQSAQGLIPAVAKGLNFSFYKAEEQPRQQLLDYLREKRILLVLDNFEHLVTDGTGLVADILDAAQGVKLLVTSRERLNLQAEQVYRVPGMRIPDPQTLAGWDDPDEQAKPYSAFQLLLERARRVRPDFQLTRANLPAVTQICRLVDGSPLGIELAVSWLDVLPEQDIAREIAHSLDFLESNAVDVPSRQRSLRGVFDTSWKLLDAQEQQAFRRLCVFQGSFSRQAAQVVSGTPLRTLLSLANKSWLEQGEDGRYHLHEVMRQYGMERLEADQDEWQETRDRHAEFFSTFLQVQGQALRTTQQIQALEALRIELESNIPQAWTWLVLTERIDVLVEKMLPGLFHYALIRSSANDLISMVKYARKTIPTTVDREGLLQQAILETVETAFELNWSMLDDRPRERLEQLWVRVSELGLGEPMGFWYIVLIAAYGGTLNYEQASRRFSEIMPVIEAFQDPWNLGYGYLLAGQYSQNRQYEVRRKYLSDALAIFQKIGAVHEQGFVLQSLAGLAASEMDYELAIDYSQAAQRMFEQVGAALSIDAIWTNLAEYYLYLGKIDQAFHAFEELRRFNEQTGNRRLLGTDLSWESLHVARYGRLEHALELRRRSLEIANEVGNQNDITWATWELGEVYRLMGDVEQARKYYLEAFPAFERMQEFIGLGFYHRGFGDIAMMKGDWVEACDQYQQALRYHEREQRSNRSWGLALTHARLGMALVQLGAFDEAKQHLKVSLSLAVGFVNPDLKALPLTGIASLMAATGFPARAVELAACVARQPTTWNEVKAQARGILEAARQALPADEVRISQERGEGLEIDALSRQVLDDPVLSG
jgi:predicted ATPase/DNA-binding SARP family transcriptional activator